MSPTNKNEKSTRLGAFVGSTGEMSNQIWDDLVEIYKVAKRLGI